MQIYLHPYLPKICICNYRLQMWVASSDDNNLELDPVMNKSAMLSARNPATAFSHPSISCISSMNK